ncbi:MAG: hypothetical protein HQK50_11665 [Oligoflexia bacterium]|nr:hypothetical protein [Oligoflexia bacterium]MBF0366221.1 hypothetical protein [Oligoflexia bacterium]
MAEKKTTASSKLSAASKKRVTPAPAQAATPSKAATKVMKAAVEFPKEHLTSWLQGRTRWGHQEWLELLASLEKGGFQELVSSEAGRNSVGAFLESNRVQH